MHKLVRRRPAGGYDSLDYRKIKQGSAEPLGNYPNLSVLPDKFARFLFELRAYRFESLDLPLLPVERKDFHVHGALEGHRHNELLKRVGGNLTKVKLHGVKLSGPIIQFALKKD